MNMNPAMDPGLLRRVEQFYYREARLLDERQFLQWLALMAEDIIYTMPGRHVPMPDSAQRSTEAYHAIDHELSRYAAGDSPLREENFFTLALRADRALKSNAYAENPPARTRRFVANVEVFSGEKPGELRVFSNLLLYYSRHGSEHFMYSGQRRDVLRHEGESFKVAAREVILDCNIIATPTVGLLF